MSLQDARKRAGEALDLLAHGQDPAVAKSNTKRAAAREPDTIAKIVQQFMKRHMEAKARSAGHIAGTQRTFDNHVLPRWGDREIKSISRTDVHELLDAIVDEGTMAKGRGGKKRHIPGGPIAANRTLAAISTMFNWALRRGLIEASPAALAEKPGLERRRERVLEAAELKTLWEACEGLGYPVGRFFQMALLTGQRREEVAGMRWADIDVDAKVWEIPAELTKARRAHVVPLAPRVVDLLASLPRKGTRNAQGATTASPYVFTTSGDTSISGFSKAKTRVDTAIAKALAKAAAEPIAPWTIHDLRRTVATELARLGTNRLVISKVLNHSDRAVTGIYDRYEYLKEKREALVAWASQMERLANPPPSDVTPIRLAVAQ
jgi:integrase